MVRVDTAGGPVELRRPTAAEVTKFEELRRVFEAPSRNGVIGGLDDGREIIKACISNMSPEAADKLLQRFPGLISRKLRAAFRAAGESGMGLERHAAAITHELRKTYAGQDLIGLRCFGVEVVLRPMQPSRYALMEKRAAADAVRGVSWPEVESIAKEHIVRPLDVGDDKALTTLLEAHPYLASDLGLLLIDRAGGEEEDLVGKLPSSSTEPTRTPCPTPGSFSPPTTGSDGSSGVGPAP